MWRAGAGAGAARAARAQLRSPEAATGRGGRTRPGAEARAARRKPLQFEDIWELPAGDKVENITTKFEQSWEQEMQKPMPSLVRPPARAAMQASRLRQEALRPCTCPCNCAAASPLRAT